MTITNPPRAARVGTIKLAKLDETISAWARATGASSEEVRAGILLARAARRALADKIQTPGAAEIARMRGLPTNPTALSRMGHLAKGIEAERKQEPPESAHAVLNWMKEVKAVARARRLLN